MGSLLFFLLFLLASSALRPGTPAPTGIPQLHAPRLGSQALSQALVLKAISGLLRAELSPQDATPRWHLPPATPRKRKAGCKSFYWKTLTSC